MNEQQQRQVPFTQKTYNFSRRTGLTGQPRLVDETERKFVETYFSKHGGKFLSQTQAIQYLLRRSWSPSDIGTILQDNKGEPVSRQAISQAKSKIRLEQERKEFADTTGN